MASREQLFRTLVLMAAADGTFSPSEQEYLESVAVRWQLDARALPEALRQIKAGERTITLPKGRDARMVFFDELIGVALEDNVVARKEMSMLKAIAKRCGLDEGEVEARILAEMQANKKQFDDLQHDARVDEASALERLRAILLVVAVFLVCALALWLFERASTPTDPAAGSASAPAATSTAESSTAPDAPAPNPVVDAPTVEELTALRQDAKSAYAALREFEVNSAGYHSAWDEAMAALRVAQDAYKLARDAHAHDDGAGTIAFDRGWEFLERDLSELNQLRQDIMLMPHH